MREELEVDYKTIVINIIGAPCAGKSTTAAFLFYLMKVAGLDVELVTEYAKDLVWEMRADTMKNQIYIFGKQHQRLFRLKNKVKYVVTDCPLILSEFYNREYNDGSDEFKNLIIHEINKFTNINVFLNRVKPYNPNGRYQTEGQSNEFAIKIKALLNELNMEFLTFDGTPEVGHEIFDYIKKLDSYEQN